MAYSITLDSAQFAAVAMFRAKKDLRFYLTGVMICADSNGAYLVGCDGHTLAVHKIDDEPRESFEMIIPAETVALAAKIKKGTLTIDCGDALGKYDGQTRRNGQIRSANGIFPFVEVDGTYPDWRRVAKHTQSPEYAFFNPDYLKRICDAGSVIRGKAAIVPVSPGGTGCGFAQLDDIGRTCAWVMPMREDLSGLPTAPGFVLSGT